MNSEANKKCRLGLGTVQFGMDYGISNRRGQNNLDEVRQILDEAKTLGIEILDTSPNYGNSEVVLGRAIDDRNQFNIITKTPVFEKKILTNKSADLLIEYFQRSLDNLGCDSLYGLLIHHTENILSPGGEFLKKALLDLKSRSLVKKIGVSVYNAAQIDEVLKIFKPDIIQLPINLFDQRLINSGHLTKLKDLKIEIHARSVFLQGLLLMGNKNIPDFFEPIKKNIGEYFLYLKENNISALVAALNFVKNINEIDFIILGVNSVGHLRENMTAFQEEVNIDYGMFAISDENFINPALWKLT